MKDFTSPLKLAYSDPRLSNAAHSGNLILYSISWSSCFIKLASEENRPHFLAPLQAITDRHCSQEEARCPYTSSTLVVPKNLQSCSPLEARGRQASSQVQELSVSCSLVHPQSPGQCLRPIWNPQELVECNNRREKSNKSEFSLLPISFSFCCLVFQGENMV